MPDPGWVAEGDYEVRASGYFYTIDGGRLVPLANARVEIMDSDSDTDTLTDDLMGVGLTAEDGSYDVRGRGDDDGSLTPEPDVYARVVLDDCEPNPVRCTNELDWARSMDTPQHDHDNVVGDVDIGSFSWGNQEDSSAPSVWLQSRRAFVDYTQIVGQAPPAGHYDIEYWSGVYAGTPWTNLDTTHWPRHYRTGGVNAHEFGHSVRHSLDGSTGHFNWDAVRFVYARSHNLPDKTNEGFAFNEGWAEFWANQVHKYNDPPDPEVEGDVAWVLAELAAHRVVGRRGMVNILANNPSRIHSIREFEDAFDVAYPGVRVRRVGNPAAIFQEGPWYHVEWPAQVAWAEREIALQQANIGSLQADLERAGAIAEKTEGVCEEADCYAVYVALTKPHRLRAVIRSKELAMNQIRSEMEARDEIAARFKDSTIDEWYSSWKSAFLRELWSVNLTGLRSALAAAAPLAIAGRGRYIVQRLARKVDVVEQSFKKGEPPPLNWQPKTLADETMEPVAGGEPLGGSNGLGR